MIARYGLRSLDIRRLKLSSFDWEKGTLNISQSKTGKLQTFPLLHDVGWAVAEYLRYGRPKCDSEYVFLTHTVPYRPFGIHSAGLNTILAKRVRMAGIVIPREVSGCTPSDTLRQYDALTGCSASYYLICTPDMRPRKQRLYTLHTDSSV